MGELNFSQLIPVDVVQCVWSTWKLNPGVSRPMASVRPKVCIADWSQVGVKWTDGRMWRITEDRGGSEVSGKQRTQLIQVFCMSSTWLERSIVFPSPPKALATTEYCIIRRTETPTSSWTCSFWYGMPPSATDNDICGPDWSAVFLAYPFCRCRVGHVTLQQGILLYNFTRLQTHLGSHSEICGFVLCETTVSRHEIVVAIQSPPTLTIVGRHATGPPYASAVYEPLQCKD